MTDDKIREWVLALQKRLHTPWEHEISDAVALDLAARELIAEVRKETIEELGPRNLASTRPLAEIIEIAEDTDYSDEFIGNVVRASLDQLKPITSLKP